ncbi:MAG: leucine-rich repeat protein, partial [Firmicutes bacterium]|nr:leucine-rich repeat protein [Bacillota bacterium]
MKRFNKLAILLVITLIGALSLIACSNDNGGTTTTPTQLSAPTGLQITGTVLMWSAVNNASGYSVQINEGAAIGNGQSTAYSLQSLSQGTYTIRVKAIGDGTNYSDSIWSSISHTVGGGGDITNYTVQFDTDGGSSIPNQTVASGGFVTRPANNPTKSGFTFDNWYADATKTILFNFSAQAITSNTTIYAKWASSSTITNHTVQFDTDGGSSIPNQTIENGGFTTRPANNPAKTGFTFDNWYSDANKTTLFNFATQPITSSTVIYAKWNAIPGTNFTVQFNTDGGSTVSNQTIASGGFATRPADNPTKNGFTFDNWYSDANKATLYNFSAQAITSNTTVYAKWIDNASFVPIDEYTFELAANFASYELVSYNGNVKQTIIPRMYDNLYVRVIRADAFKDNTALEQVEIPDSIHTIGASAFEGCASLKMINIPNNVTTISDKAFFGCTSLDSAQIATASIGISVFEECTNLKTVTLTNEVRTLGARVFYNCSSLQDMVLPDTVTAVGAMGFRYCTTLQSIKLSENLTIISNSLLAGCSALKNITIPAKITNIGESALSDCTGLEKITILGDDLTSIQNAAFYDCTNLKEIYIDFRVYLTVPANNYIFYNGGISGAGIEITFGKNIATFPNTLFVPFGTNNLPKITKITFEQGSIYSLVQVADFASMPFLTDLTLPDSVLEVAKNALTTTPWYANQANGLVYSGKVLVKYKGTMPQNQTVTVAANTVCVADAAFENCAPETLILPFVGANKDAAG